jgi:pilus assembly protein FimV
LERRPDGRAFIRLSSDRPINDPFVDIILEATWSSGRIVRDYTMLFDPPTMRQPAAAPALTLPQVTSTPVAANPVEVPVDVAAASASTPAPVVAPAQPTAEAGSKPTPPKPASTKSAQVAASPKPALAPKVEGANQVVVKTGDTASKIVGSVKTTGVSLDQMLVALLRANPDAFVNGNLNRVRAGAVVNIPTADQALAVSAPEATQIVIAQSKDFNDFRRNLASSAPAAPVAAASRTASGSVQTKVEDKKAAAPTPDKLTLSKGAIQGKTDEAKIAKERADKDAQARAAEISKNISDLEKLKAAAAATATPAPATSAAPTAAKAPAEVMPPPQVAVAPTLPIAVAPVVPPAPTPGPAAPVVKPPAPTVTPEVEAPGLIDELSQNPLLLAGGLGLLAILGAIGIYTMRKRKKNAAHVDSSFLESRLQPDSFFGASGGQRVDTNNGNSVGGSSMVYSASQLDAADDVDPVAEADVYLAYGRDLQAEEILKEAVRTTPGRLAVHTKLLEIYAKRRDAKNFEATAMQAYRLAGSNSADWARACELGLSIDPSNSLYQPGGAPADSSLVPLMASEPSPTFNSTVPHATEAKVAPEQGGVDLDLDFSLDEAPPSAISDLTGASLGQAKYDQTVKLKKAPAPANDMEMDFDLSDSAPLSANSDTTPSSPLPEISLSMDGVSLTERDTPAGQDFGAADSTPVQAKAPKATEPDSGMLEFDLGSLSLDLDASSPALAEGPSAENEDPLGTKLALAEEFVSIGDEDGARALIEEVMAESSGEMRAKAQRALASLS